MAITFKVDSTTAEGTFIRVLRDGRPFGKIFDAVGLYRFYEADHEKLGSADLKDVNLDRLTVRPRSNRGTNDEDEDTRSIATQRAAWESLRKV
jgi:hypothetical protein